MNLSYVIHQKNKLSMCFIWNENFHNYSFFLKSECFCFPFNSCSLFFFVKIWSHLIIDAFFNSFFLISVNEHSEKTRACNYLHRMLIWLDYRVIINALHEYAMTLESLRYIKWMQIDRLKKTIKSLWLNKKTFTFLPLFVMRKKSIERINHTSRIDE